MLRSFHEGRADAETIRNAILIIGGLMAFYGLVQATKRQETFAEQVQTFTEQAKTQAEQTKIQIKQADTAETQLFNDRLGRGVELLANPAKMLSKAGIRVLEDLANSVDVIEHKKIIANLLHDFIRGRTAIINQDDKKDNSVPDHVDESNDQSDVQLALDVYLGLMSLQNMVKPMQDFTNLDLRELDFSLFESQCDQNDRLKKLHSIDFSDSILNECDFKELELYSCQFFATQIERCDFSLSSCFDCGFSSKDIISFTGRMLLRFEHCSFYVRDIKFESRSAKLKFTNCHFFSKNMIMACRKVTFLGGGIYSSKDSQITVVKLTNRAQIVFFAIDISKVSVDRKSESRPLKIDISKSFFKKGSKFPSFEHHTPVDESRAYLKRGVIKCFIKSDAEWSEKPVDEWIEEEIRQWEREEIEESQAEMQVEHIEQMYYDELRESSAKRGK
ncbi:hypothetical protein OAT37_04820 [Alphaproteobacteria bacterium]|nr:hypothetical protein [Alphaproteobacteria bacterium]